MTETQLQTQEYQRQINPILSNTGANLEATDYEVPRISLLYGTSKAVKNKQGFEGDIFSNIGPKKLGDKESPVEFVPLFLSKSVVTTVLGSGKFVKQVPFSGQSFPPTEKIDGASVRNDLAYNFYIFLPKEYDEDNLHMALVSFNKSNSGAARRINSLTATALEKGGKYSDKTLTLGVETRVSGDGKDYPVFMVTAKGNTDEKYKDVIDRLEKRIMAGAFKVEETETFTEESVDEVTAKY